MMSDVRKKFPFEKLFVVVVGHTKRVYTSQGPARARVTNATSRQTQLFEDNCELWEIDDLGWKLILVCSIGDHSSIIPWNNIAESRKKEKERYEKYMKEIADERDLEEYNRLKEKFEM